jgi:hypothetical protein
MVVFNDNHFGTSMPGAGAVHPIKTFEFPGRYDRNVATSNSRLDPRRWEAD